MNSFIFNYIYENEKDSQIQSSEEFKQLLKEKYKIIVGKFDNNDLYKKIVNYQIKKYGRCLMVDKSYCPNSYEENNRKKENARQRKKNKRYYWNNK